MTGPDVPQSEYLEWRRKKQAALNNRLYRIQRELHALGENYPDLRPSTVQHALLEASEDLAEIESLQCELYREDDQTYHS